MPEPLLGGPGYPPASVEEKQEFRRLMKRFPLLTNEELATAQRIEWGLTKSEYTILKFGE